MRSQIEADGSPDRIITVEPSGAGDRSYEVMVGGGLFADAGPYIVRSCPAHRYAIVTDSQVAPLYGDRLVRSLSDAGARSSLFTFPAGETSKTRGGWEQLSDELVESGFGRDSAVVALGGGVVGDLAGFVAATYMRGIPYVQVPTTLLAMLDSSVGGKTGVDTKAGKNLIGAFHQPSLVLIDPETLSTLPDRHLSAGLAEAYKHGLILDGAYFEWLEAEVEGVLARASGTMEQLVSRSVEIKASVVARDEREAGYRSILNFGHTVAHALETAGGFELLHGEAVAVGMVAEATIGEELSVTEPGISERIRAALEKAGLPVEASSNLDRTRFNTALASDKKRVDAAPRVVLLESVGRVALGREGAWTHGVPLDVVERAVFGTRRGV